MKKIIIKPIKLIKVKPFKTNILQDTDRDGVPDWRDCAPFNPRRHRISRTMKKRLEKLPVYVSPRSLEEERERRISKIKQMGEEGEDIPTFESYIPSVPNRKYPQIMTKEAEKESPEARQMFLSTVKKYPGVVGEIEKIQPKEIIVTSKSPPRGRGRGTGFIDPMETMFIGSTRKGPSKYQQKRVARALYHELTHAKQLQQTPFEELYKQYERDVPYTETPIEQEANIFAEQKLKEYKRKQKIPPEAYEIFD